MSLIFHSLGIFLLVLLTACTSSVTEPVEDSETTPSENISQIDCGAEPDKCFCDLPDGRKLKNGAKLPMFKNSVASCGLSCSQQQTEVVCQGGVLMTNPEFSYLTCREAECKACELPWGERLEEGTEIQIFTTEQVGCTSSCQGATIRCSNGRLTGANLNTHRFPNCRVAQCQDCTTPWGDRVPDGGSVRGFRNPSVKCGLSCESKNLLCVSGNFTVPQDVVDFPNISCRVETCTECRTPWGTVISNGQQVMAFRSGAVPCDQSCVEGGNMASRVCVDGVLTGSAEHRFGSCAPEVCDEGGGAPGFVCRIPWSREDTALAGTQITAYTRQDVACNDSCDRYRFTRSCRLQDGLFDGPPHAIYQNCTRNCRE